MKNLELHSIIVQVYSEIMQVYSEIIQWIQTIFLDNDLTVHIARALGAYRPWTQFTRQASL